MKNKLTFVYKTQKLGLFLPLFPPSPHTFPFLHSMDHNNSFHFLSAYSMPIMLTHFCNTTLPIKQIFPFYRRDLESLHEQSFPRSHHLKEANPVFESSFLFFFFYCKLMILITKHVTLYIYIFFHPCFVLCFYLYFFYETK